MGFAMAQQLDPVSRASVSVPARLATLLAGAVFLGAGLHLECLMLIRASFMVVPPGAAGVPWDSLMALTQMGGDLFFVGVRLGGPIVALVWMINVFVGVLAKLAPRMNVFFSVGMTVTSVVGIIVLALATPMMLGEHLEVVGAGLIRLQICSRHCAEWRMTTARRRNTTRVPKGGRTRREGPVSRSADLGSVAVILTGTAALTLGGAWMADAVVAVFEIAWEPRAQGFTQEDAVGLFQAAPTTRYGGDDPALRHLGRGGHRKPQPDRGQLATKRWSQTSAV